MAGDEGALDPQAIFDYLYYHVCPGPQTILDGVLRVPPGHCVEFGAGASTEPSPYWSMAFTEDRSARVEDLKAEFVTCLQDSVREATEEETRVGQATVASADVDPSLMRAV